MALRWVPETSSENAFGGEETDSLCECKDPVYLMEIDCGSVSLMCKGCRKSPPFSWGDWEEVFCLDGPIEVKITWDSPDVCTCRMRDQLSCDCDSYAIATVVKGEGNGDE